MRIKFFYGMNISQISLHNIFHVERMVIETQTGLSVYGLGDQAPKKKKKKPNPYIPLLFLNKY